MQMETKSEDSNTHKTKLIYKQSLKQKKKKGII